MPQKLAKIVSAFRTDWKLGLPAQQFVVIRSQISACASKADLRREAETP
jgi:hypothetical protein